MGNGFGFDKNNDSDEGRKEIEQDMKRIYGDSAMGRKAFREVKADIEQANGDEAKRDEANEA